MPPEAITGALTGRPTATCASDVFSLGATLYWMLVGAPPVPIALSYEQSRNYVEAARVVPLKEVAPHVGDYVCRVIGKAMSVKSSDRYPSVTELHAELGQARAAEASGRQWRQTATHSGHERCWDCPDASGRKGLRLCLVPTVNAKHSIDVSYVDSSRRVSSIQTTSARSGRDLRKAFKSH